MTKREQWELIKQRDPVLAQFLIEMKKHFSFELVAVRFKGAE